MVSDLLAPYEQVIDRPYRQFSRPRLNSFHV